MLTTDLTKTPNKKKCLKEFCPRLSESGMRKCREKIGQLFESFLNLHNIPVLGAGNGEGEGRGRDNLLKIFKFRYLGLSSMDGCL